MNTYKALVRLAVPGSLPKLVPTQVTAANANDARLMLYAMYGKANLVGTPVQVK